MDSSNPIQIIKNNSKGFPKIKIPFIVKGNLKTVIVEPEKINSKWKISKKMTSHKYGKTGHMATTRKKLEINNPKIHKKISKIALVHLKHLYIPQSINQRKSNSNYNFFFYQSSIKLISNNCIFILF